MRLAIIVLHLAACVTEAPPKQPKTPRLIDLPEASQLTSAARSCPTKYTPDKQKAAPVELASAGTVIIAARGQVDKLRPYVFAHGADAIAAALEMATTDHAASLSAAIDRVPTGCQPAWFLEQRIDIQPAFTDTPPERARVIDAGIEELAATTQIVGACGGCPAIALAFTSTSPPLVSAWLVP